jgi:oligoendopeptidase F
MQYPRRRRISFGDSKHHPEGQVLGRTTNPFNVSLFLVALVLVTGSTNVAVAQERTQTPATSAARISPTLYFSSPSEEIASRNALHARVTDLVRDLARADPAALLGTLKVSDQILISLQRHSAYLKVRSLEDTEDQAAKDAGEAIETDQSVLEAAIKSRLRLVPKDQVAALGPYALLAQEAKEEVAHAFSPDTERYRGAVTTSFEQDIQNTYDRLTETLGSSKEVSSSDIAIRRAAISHLNDVYNEAAPRTATLLGSLVDIENRDAAAQGYANAADRKYQSLGLSTTVINQTLAAVEAEAPIYRHYQQVLAEHTAQKLGLASVLPAELELGYTSSPPMSFAQRRVLILDALQPLGKDYTSRFAQLLDPANGRLDLAGGQHRSRSGTSISVYDAPVALYFGNYDGSLRSTSTLAHEGGHAIHRELMNAGGIPIYERSGPHYLNEGFAIFNELLVLDHASELANTRVERESALERLLAKISLELFTSAEETAFERSLYTENRGSALLDRTQIDVLFADSIRPYEYWPVEEVGVSHEWMRKRLLFDDPLYLVNYLYAAVVAVALYDRAHTDPDFASKYEALLRRGFDADPQVILARMGIQLDDPSLVKAAARLLQTKTDELQQLYRAEGQPSR